MLSRRLPVRLAHSALCSPATARPLPARSLSAVPRSGYSGSLLTVSNDIGADGQPTGVVVLAFNRPDSLNPLTAAMGEEFTQVLGDLGQSADVRALVLTGNGRAFSAGGDLEFLRERTRTSPMDNQAIMRAFYHRFLTPLINLPVPTIAAINGHAVGAGLCVALACDLRLASTKAKMGLNFVRIGLTPGMGGSFTLPIIAGPQAAARLILTGDLVAASEAAALGLVLRQVEHDHLMAESMALARRIASASPVAVRQTVKTLRMRFHDGAFERALQREADTQAICYGSADMAEGLDAIAQKRDPVFAGR
ncbi:3-hydroxybutyryl-CoA dehydratase-like protein, mitochondrial [Entophlyctis helioformis]|nr:3-hydroxybutyryl-CoA dehydratase-like protein, mitochondrial [Entophlyctis helioformis]